MTFPVFKGLSKQAISIYRQLLQKEKLSAKQISAALHILPNAVYRHIHYLEQLGLIEEINTYPKSFKAKDKDTGWNHLIAHQKTLYDQLLTGIKTEKSQLALKDYSITFIQGREAVFEQCIKDLNKTKKAAKFIVLGLSVGISPELMLAQKRAVERGVAFKEIIQEYTEENKEMIHNWLKQGFNIRQGRQAIGFHLLLFDDNISYIMYYDPDAKTKRYAVRIVHKGINQQLQTIFNKHWQEAEVIK